jgi:hypothetical protein
MEKLSSNIEGGAKPGDRRAYVKDFEGKSGRIAEDSSIIFHSLGILGCNLTSSRESWRRCSEMTLLGHEVGEPQIRRHLLAGGSMGPMTTRMDLLRRGVKP